MSASTHAVDFARLESADVLHHVVQGLDDSLVHDDDHPALVRVVRRIDDAEVAVRPLDEHPGEALWGFTAPPDWWALGVIGAGWASPVELQPPGGDRADDTSSDRRRVRVIHLVSRDGDAVTVHRTVGAPGVARHSSRDPGRGLLDDCCRRALSLPTAPPPASTMGLWCVLWLDGIVTAAMQGALDHATWADVAGRHPALQTLTRMGGGAPLRSWAERELVRAAELFAAEYTWSRLLAMQRAGRGTVSNLAPALAVWMDEGIFARTVLAGATPADAAVDSLRALLSPALVARIAAAVADWSPLPTCPSTVPEGTADEDR